MDRHGALRLAMTGIFINFHGFLVVAWSKIVNARPSPAGGGQPGGDIGCFFWARIALFGSAIPLFASLKPFFGLTVAFFGLIVPLFGSNVPLFGLCHSFFWIDRTFIWIAP